MSTPRWSLRDSKNISQEERDRLFKEARKDSPRTHLMIALCYNAALRVSELIHLCVSDFHYDNLKISILPLKKAGRKVIRENGSTRIIERELPRPVDYPVPASVMDLSYEYVKKHLRKGNRFLFPGRTRRCHIVKMNCTGGHISKREVQYTFDRIAKRARIKVPGRGIHCLKHARLTEVAEKTKDPYLVREIGRHESVAMSDHYVRYINLQEKVREIGGKV